MIPAKRHIRTNYVLGIDPSGAFHEGKGTTGWNLFDCVNFKVLEVGTISAKDFSSRDDYWEAHIKLIRKYLKQYGFDVAVSIEDYILYRHCAESQINSTFETIQLLGVIKHYCWSNAVTCNLRSAVIAKQRWTIPILVHKTIIIPCGSVLKASYICECRPDSILCDHEIDSIRHSIHYSAFENLQEEYVNENGSRTITEQQNISNGL